MHWAFVNIISWTNPVLAILLSQPAHPCYLQIPFHYATQVLSMLWKMLLLIDIGDLTTIPFVLSKITFHSTNVTKFCYLNLQSIIQHKDDPCFQKCDCSLTLNSSNNGRNYCSGFGSRSLVCNKHWPISVSEKTLDNSLEQQVTLDQMQHSTSKFEAQTDCLHFARILQT